MASTVVLELSASVVSATPIYGRATVWGSESIGANHTPPGFSWRKHYDEVTQQRSTAWFIANKFGLNGYDADDYQGDEGSYKNLILAQISDNEASYPRVAVIDFDHGVGRTDYGDYNPQVPEGEYHYLLEDNYGSYDGTDYDNKGAPHHEHIVYDMDIAYQTTMEKTFFALINTCMSANLANGEGPVPGTSRVQGMPYAWTHRYVRDKDLPSFDIAYDMSDDGYHKPDSGKFCYLGFEGGSAALSQTIACWPVSPYYHIWLEHFFA